MNQRLSYRTVAGICLMLTFINSHAQITSWKYYEAEDDIPFEEILDRPSSDGEIEESFNFSFYENAVWLKAKAPMHNDPYFILINNPTITEIDFFLLEGGVLRKEIRTGASRPLDSREFKYSKFLFEVPAADADRTILIRLKTNAALFGSIRMLDQEGYFAAITNDQGVSFVVNGILLALTVIYLIIFLTLRDRIYLYYFLYVFCIVISVARINGSISLFPYLDFSWLYNYQSLAEAGVSVTAGIFAIHFLRLRRYSRFFFKFLWVLVLLQAMFFFIGLFDNQLATQLVQSVAFLYIVVMTPLATYIYVKRRFAPALYFLISWLLLFVGSVIYIFSSAGLIQSTNLLITHSLEIGVALEMIFLSLGVSKRIDDIVKTNLRIKGDNIRMLGNQKEMLEKLVNEKTALLANQNQELQTKIEQLNEAQTRLLKAEKLASLGTLSAGIAHEINNPLNFISGGLQNLQKEGQQNKHESKFIAYMEEGVKRISSIVKSLGILSQKDEQMESYCDVHNILDNCLSILEIESKIGVSIRKEYALEHTRLIGDPSNLHLAFMNVLNNALQSIEGDRGEVSIKTEEEEGQMLISISDTGNGIKPEDYSRVGDPFYTTKNPGEGIGLGLYLTYNIISDHHGSIDFTSEEGVGSTFKIHFPIKLESEVVLEQ